MRYRALLVALLLVLSVAICGLSAEEELTNDSRKTAVAVRITFMTRVMITGHGREFSIQEPASGLSDVFVFSGGEVRRNGTFEVKWSPGLAIKSVEWLVEGALLTISTVEEALLLLPELGVLNGGAGNPSRTQLQTAILLIERALGLSDAVDYTNPVAYSGLVSALQVSLEQRSWLNSVSRGYYVLGRNYLSSSGAKLAFEAGKAWGLRSLEMTPLFTEEQQQNGFFYAVKKVDDPASILWTYNNWACLAEYDPLAALFAGHPDKLTALVEQLAILDSSALQLLTPCNPQL